MMNKMNLSQLAKKALLEEVNLDCKPGLVCRNSQGAHNDMDIETFYLSANALVSHFDNYQQITIKHQRYDLHLFNQLRQEGIKAERSMFKATKGINTHKGANFIFSLLIAATTQLDCFDIDTIKNRIIALSQSLLDDFKDLDKQTTLSHGQQLYKKHGVLGIRAQAMLGFPLLFDYPFSMVDKTQQSLYEFLFGSMQHLEDTTILHRGDFEGLQWTQEFSKTLTYELIQSNFDEINQQFIDRWISPGGSADFLSAAIYLRDLKQIFDNEHNHG